MYVYFLVWIQIYPQLGLQVHLQAHLRHFPWKTLCYSQYLTLRTRTCVLPRPLLEIPSLYLQLSRSTPSINAMMNCPAKVVNEAVLLCPIHQVQAFQKAFYNACSFCLFNDNYLIISAGCWPWCWLQRYNNEWAKGIVLNFANWALDVRNTDIFWILMRKLYRQKKQRS